MDSSLTMTAPPSIGQIEAIKRDVLGARDLLNRMLDMAAASGERKRKAPHENC